MKQHICFYALLLCMALLLSGCGLRTVDELYCLPKRSDADSDLQSVIDKAMSGHSYSAPIYGENRQVTQKVDLDGDGIEECLVFAKDSSEKPLKIMIFCQLASGYVLMDTIEGYGFAFDFIDYAQMDGKPGLEIIVGRQVSNEVVRSVSVYRFSSEISRHLMSASYNRIHVSDLDTDGNAELLLLSAGEADGGRGSLSVYHLSDGQLQCTDMKDIAGSVESVKRTTEGKLQDDKSALFITTLAKDGTLATDIFCMDDGMLYNISYGDPVPPLGSYFLYPEDLDADGVMELPELVKMPDHPSLTRQQYFVQWYSMSRDGTRQNKRAAYMNMKNGWYLQLQKDWLNTMSVVQSEDACSFYLWDPGHQTAQKVMTIYALTDSDREEIVEKEDYIILYKGDAVILGAKLEKAAQQHQITAASLKSSFYMMRTELNTEED